MAVPLNASLLGKIGARLSSRPRLIVDRGNALVAAGRHGDAETLLAQGLTLFPRNEPMLRLYAFLAHSQQKYEVAADRFASALARGQTDPALHCGLASSLRQSGRCSDANLVIAEALLLFPEDFGLLSEAAQVSAAGAEHQEALSYWNRAENHHGRHPDLLLGRSRTFLALGDVVKAKSDYLELVARSAEYATLPDLAWLIEDDVYRPKVGVGLQEGEPISPAHLVCEFESLGENCEFGLLQRYCGVEPLSLLRFSSSFNRRTLIQALDDLFSPMTQTSDVVINIDWQGEYICSSRHYQDFDRHTYLSINDVDIEEVTRREIKRTAYLRDRLVSDLRAGERIFVRREREVMVADPANLVQAIRRHGPNTLLWIKLADADNLPGSVEPRAEGLLVGYIRCFADDPHLDMHGWLEVCRKALAIARRRQHAYRIAPTAVYQAGRVLEAADQGASRPLDRDLILKGRTAQRFSLGADSDGLKTLVAHRLLDAHVPDHSLVAFSLWVWVPQEFKGSAIEVGFMDSSVGAMNRADLSRRCVWQRIWASTRMPAERRRAHVCLRMNGVAADHVFSGEWLLEEGCCPHGL